MLNVPAEGPGGNHLSAAVVRETFLLANTLGILHGEGVGKEFQEILTATRLLHFFFLLFLAHGFAEEVLFAPEVVAQAPLGEIGNLLAPRHVVSYVEHHGLQVGDGDGTVRQLLVDLVIGQRPHLGTLLGHPTGQVEGLAALDEARGEVEVGDEGTKGVGVGLVVATVGEGLALVGQDGAEVQTAQRAVHQASAEELYALLDGRGGVPVPPDVQLLLTASNS